MKDKIIEILLNNCDTMICNSIAGKQEEDWLWSGNFDKVSEELETLFSSELQKKDEEIEELKISIKIIQKLYKELKK